MLKLDLLNQLIQGIDVAILTSQHPTGQLHSRPMLARHAAAGGVLWFFSAAHSSKIDDIRNSAEVNVAYQDPTGKRYVSISGTCEAVRNSEIARELWSKDYETWFPRGLADPDLILLKITINTAEYWDVDSGRMVPLTRTDVEPAPGPAVHGTITLHDESKDVA